MVSMKVLSDPGKFQEAEMELPWEKTISMRLSLSILPKCPIYGWSNRSGKICWFERSFNCFTENLPKLNLFWLTQKIGIDTFNKKDII
jgi:hypothetical protein